MTSKEEISKKNRKRKKSKNVKTKKATAGSGICCDKKIHQYFPAQKSYSVKPNKHLEVKLDLCLDLSNEMNHLKQECFPLKDNDKITETSDTVGFLNMSLHSNPNSSLNEDSCKAEELSHSIQNQSQPKQQKTYVKV